MISPFFIDQLNEPPIKQKSAWNDSLLKLAGIHNITITSKGMKNPEDISELMIFNFNNAGALSKFEQFNYETSKEAITEINFSGNSGVINRYYGEAMSQELKNDVNGVTDVFVRKRSAEFSDSCFVFGSIFKPAAIVEKTGKYTSRINIILKENESLKSIRKVIVKLGIDTVSMNSAEMFVTYIDKNYRPLKSYLVTEGYVQTALVAEWNYENHKKLISYRKFVNTSPVKEYEFEYSEDKLLRSFIYNRIKYFVDYQ
jgi:hypothetical protein